MKLFTLLIYMNILTNQQIINDFKSERIQRTEKFTINGEIENVFPLFGPVREMEWAEGWNPEIVYRSTSDMLVEERMIFQTKGENEKYTWAITQYQPEKYLIEYTVSTPERIWFIRVQCNAFEEKTHATVSYIYTGMTEEGNRKNAQALKRMFAHDLKDWEAAINYYLKTGNLLLTIDSKMYDNPCTAD
jgi:hypothetical protein